MEGVGVPTGELVLVFFAVVLSLLLTVWVTVGVDEDAEPRRIMGVTITPAMFYEFGVWVLAGSCLVCGFLPLGLMFSGRVSLDATATALTGLLPAVIVLLGDDVRLLKARAHMRKTPTLRTDAALRFLRLGAVDVRRVVFSDPNIETTPEEAEYTLCRDAKDDERYTTVHHLYSQPPKGDSQRRDTAVAALALAVDLVVAGDLVLHYFEDYLRSLVRSPHFHKSLDTTAATCNQFFEKVGLANQWGPISASSSSFGTPDGFSKCTRGQKYGMVFFLLTEASGNFAVEAGTALGLGTHLVDLLSLKDSATQMPTEVAPSGAPVPPPRKDAVEQKVFDAIHKWLGAWKARDLPPRESIADEAGPRVEPLDRVTVVRDS
ncbi:hypothetical protein I4F81_007109 [Pyropia yezoensis]|uniref:Uncharacterized protein n=1 Tax=Pyropia yezoensis TaxID=2788 RepID=A0ACC3C389_PYRYE|nr:hypothetical protein I4F81_007109 [Neopyropia yezoensis]